MSAVVYDLMPFFLVTRADNALRMPGEECDLLFDCVRCGALAGERCDETSGAVHSERQSTRHFARADWILRRFEGGDPARPQAVPLTDIYAAPMVRAVEAWLERKDGAALKTTPKKTRTYRTAPPKSSETIAADEGAGSTAAPAQSNASIPPPGGNSQGCLMAARRHVKTPERLAKKARLPRQGRAEPAGRPAHASKRRGAPSTRQGAGGNSAPRAKVTRQAAVRPAVAPEDSQDSGYYTEIRRRLEAQLPRGSGDAPLEALIDLLVYGDPSDDPRDLLDRVLTLLERAHPEAFEDIRGRLESRLPDELRENLEESEC